MIVPARNEEACLAECLQSLTTQSGVAFEIIVVDDHSTDRTREIATSFPGVRVIEAGPLPDGWTGKNNAVTAGARQAHGEWLLFTDADTVHLPGSLAAALKEAEENGAEMLSYSPQQVAGTFWEMATLPVVFAELARQYSPSKVSDPASTLAAANGQYILIRRDAYDAVGGHAAISGHILEDVALARNVKNSGRRIRFRYAGTAVRTRMYRNYRQLRDGWTKNLALLFPNPGWLAVKSLILWGVAWGPFFAPDPTDLALRLAASTQLPADALSKVLDLMVALNHSWLRGIAILGFIYLVQRLRHSNFGWSRNVLGALFGMPMFAYLLLRSKRAHANNSVRWKGRTYGSDLGGSDTDGVNKLTQRTTTVAGRLS